MRIAPLPLLVALLLTLAGCSSRPAPMSFDARELPNGTGERVFHYDHGPVMLREDYANGVLMRSRWFTPAGELIQETQWDNQSGEGIFLRQDGSVHIRMQFENGLANGPAVYYDNSGGIANIVFFENGQPRQY